jgi:hypothetical protein
MYMLEILALFTPSPLIYLRYLLLAVPKGQLNYGAYSCPFMVQLGSSISGP